MQSIYTYIPETNHVPRKHRDATILVLLFMVLISLVPTLTQLYLYISTFRSMCAVPSMAVLCSSLNLWFSGMLHSLLFFIFIIIIIIVITFTQCICSYVTGTNHISIVYSVAAVLYLQFVLLVMLFCP
jgi:hypothetical protein